MSALGLGPVWYSVLFRHEISCEETAGWYRPADVAGVRNHRAATTPVSRPAQAADRSPCVPQRRSSNSHLDHSIGNYGPADHNDARRDANLPRSGRYEVLRHTSRTNCVSDSSNKGVGSEKGSFLQRRTSS